MATRQPDPWAASLKVDDDIGELWGGSDQHARIATITKVTKTQIHTKPKAGWVVSKWSKVTCEPVGKGSTWAARPSIVPLDNPQWVACRKKILADSYRRKIIEAVEGVGDLKILRDMWSLLTPGDPS